MRSSAGSLNHLYAAPLHEFDVCQRMPPALRDSAHGGVADRVCGSHRFFTKMVGFVRFCVHSLRSMASGQSASGCRSRRKQRRMPRLGRSRFSADTNVARTRTCSVISSTDSRELHGERDLGDHQSSMHIFAQKQSRKE